MSQAELVSPTLARHLCTQSCENVSGETAWNTAGQGILEPRVARMSQAKLARQPRAGHPGAQSLREASGELARSPQVRAYRIPELRGCHGKLTGQPRARHLGAQNCEDISGDTCQTTSRAASRSLELRRRRRRSWPNHLPRGISEPRVARLSQAELAGQPRAQHLRTQSCEDVSGATGWINS